MKTISIILFLFILCGTYSQDRLQKEKIVLKKPPQLSVESQTNRLVEFIIKKYGKKFIFYEELKKGNYCIDQSNPNTVFLKIFNKVNSNKQFTKINLEKRLNSNGITELILAKGEIEKFIEINSQDYSNITFPTYRQINTIIERNNILWDKMILSHPDLPEEDWRILNRGFLTKYEIQNQNGEPAQLFKSLAAAKILPYDYGRKSKIVTVDNLFHSIIYFDSEFMNCDGCTNGYYGSIGIGSGQFLDPTGIATGQPYENGGYIVYPLFIADNHNFRIVHVDYNINTSNPKNSYISNFNVIHDTIISPFDLAYYSHELVDDQYKYSDPYYDRLWIGQSSSWIPQLTCMDPASGGIFQRVIGYKDETTGTVYPFEAPMVPRLSVYRNIPLLSFIDSKRNCLITCELDPSGLAATAPYPMDPYWDGQVIVAKEILKFPDNIKINSVSFQKLNSITEQWPYVWVTSGYQPPFESESMIHCLKMNSDGHTQYLASTKLPRNSQTQFINLYNLAVTNNYYDILAIERWSDSYGVRQYWPFADLATDTINDICLDTTNILRWNAVFTNECYVKMQAHRLNHENNWEPVKIKKLNGVTQDEYEILKFQIAGWNQETSDNFIDLQLDLPLEDYLLGGRVKLIARLYPEYEENPWESNECTYIEREVDVKKSCGPKPGGCPYIYVKNEQSDFVIDNNLLHRSEFTENQNTDIKDVYKLRVKPGIFDNKITVSVAENENDQSYFDQFKLYFIDHTIGTIAGVTENNDVILYNPSNVLSTDSSMLNLVNITNLIQYQSQIGTKVYSGDSSLSHYPLLDKTRKSKLKKTEIGVNAQKNNNKLGPGSGIKDSIALVALMGNFDTLQPISQKNWAGNLIAFPYSDGAIVSKSFARRERLSEVIIPLFGWQQLVGEYVQQIDVSWLSDINLKYFSVVPITYKDIGLVNIPLIEAIHTGQGDILSQVQYLDGVYGSLDSNALITLKFDLANLPLLDTTTLTRDYFIEVNGKYFITNNNSATKIVEQVPLKFNLSQNYPNPFNPITKINYELPKNTKVNIVIYDILGREVIKLVNNELKQAGRYTVEFNGQNYASGVYFYRIEAGDFVLAKKMVLVK